MTSENFSLKQLLLVTLLLTSFFTWGITAFLSYRDIRAEVYSLFDNQLAQSAMVIHAFVESLLHEGSFYENWDLDSGIAVIEDEHIPSEYRTKVAFQIWMIDEGLILRTKNAPEYPLANTTEGLSRIRIENKLWDVFALTGRDKQGDKTYIIYVAQQDVTRETLADDVSTFVLEQFLVGMPILGVAIWFIVGNSLKSINRLTWQLKSRDADRLTPLPIRRLPLEIVPVVEAMNDLFARLKKAFENERQFIANASHELRTPLAGIMMQTQVALKTSEAAGRTLALQKIELGVRRMTHMVQQLLILSRIDSDGSEVEKQPIDLNQQAIQVISELDHDAHSRRIKIALYNNNTQLIHGNAQLINVLLRNIIDNAIKYTPVGGKIRVTIDKDKNLVILSVEDSGPGIPKQLRKQVLTRFYRHVETANTTTGSGLGLSIVSHIATIHLASIYMDQSSLGGLKVSLIFSSHNRKKTKK
jgi:two-component system, OmpR family, sensor histidine kinase QseC